MKIHDNGVDREATPQEIAAHEKLCEEAAEANAKLNEKK